MKPTPYIAAALVAATIATNAEPANAGIITRTIGSWVTSVASAINGSRSTGGLAPRTSAGAPMPRSIGLGLEDPLPPLTRDLINTMTPREIDRYERARGLIERNNRAKINRARGQSSSAYRSRSYGATAQNGGRITDFTAYATSFGAANTRTPGVR